MSIPQSSAERIKLARNMLGLSRKEIEERFHISANTLQSWELGRNILTTKGAKRLSTFFVRQGLLCSDSWLLTGEGQLPKLLEGSESLPQTLTEDLVILSEIEAFKAINSDPVIIIIRDDSMEPVYNFGDYVAGNKRVGNDIARLVGTHCIVETGQGDTFVRKVLLGSKRSLFSLACINNYSQTQPIIPDVKLRYAAQIIWHRTKEVLLEEE